MSCGRYVQHMLSQLRCCPHLGFVMLWIATGASPSHDATLGLLALGATAMGMRSAAVRGLNVGGVFTTAATATFVYLVGDIAHEPITGEERFRLTGVLVSVVIGATAFQLWRATHSV